MAGKNSQIHLLLETSLKHKLEEEAKYNEVSLSELCRQKLSKTSQLSRIEIRLERIEKKLNSCT